MPSSQKQNEPALLTKLTGLFYTPNTTNTQTNSNNRDHTRTWSTALGLMLAAYFAPSVNAFHLTGGVRKAGRGHSTRSTNVEPASAGPQINQKLAYQDNLDFLMQNFPNVVEHVMPEAQYTAASINSAEKLDDKELCDNSQYYCYPIKHGNTTYQYAFPNLMNMAYFADGQEYDKWSQVIIPLTRAPKHCGFELPPEIADWQSFTGTNNCEPDKNTTLVSAYDIRTGLFGLGRQRSIELRRIDNDQQNLTQAEKCLHFVLQHRNGQVQDYYDEQLWEQIDYYSDKAIGGAMIAAAIGFGTAGWVLWCVLNDRDHQNTNTQQYNESEEDLEENSHETTALLHQNSQGGSPAPGLTNSNQE